MENYGKSVYLLENQCKGCTNCIKHCPTQAIRVRNGKAQIMKEDKSRASYYNFYSTKKWGALDSYDMFVNSSLVSIDDTVELICGCLAKLDQLQNKHGE